MISGVVTGTRAVGLGCARTIPFKPTPCAMRARLRDWWDTSMKIIETLTLIQFVNDGWSFAAFIAVLIYLYFTRS